MVIFWVLQGWWTSCRGVIRGFGFLKGKCIRWPCHQLTCMLTWEIRNSSSLNIKEFQGYAGIVGNLLIENGGFTKIFKSFKNLFVVLSGYGDVVCASRVAKSYGFGCGRPNYCGFANSLNIWEFVIIHQWASRNFKDYLQQFGEARKGMLERKVVSECFFFKGFFGDWSVFRF